MPYQITEIGPHTSEAKPSQGSSHASAEWTRYQIRKETS